MSDHTSRHADWKAPAEDSQILIWPEPSALIQQTHENARRLAAADSILIQGRSLSKLRRAARQFIGHDSDAPLIATGHQTELYHPGVWIKNAMINAIARKIGGAAFHFAVDTDAPKHLHLRWPGGAEPITDDGSLTSAGWTSLLSPPTPQHLASIEDKFRVAAEGWSFTPSIDPFFTSLRSQSLEPRDLSSTLTNALHALDWDLGMRHHALVVSPIWQSEAYLIFVHHLMATCATFARNYNAVLTDYRQRNGVRTAARPMPDLRISNDEIELPFWMDDVAKGNRSRAALRLDGSGWSLAAGGSLLRIDSLADASDASSRLLKWCRENRVRITPRALTLTMFFRLFLADQFVHGIGGARYDQVTDALIQRHFDLEPPGFSVTTATMYFPATLGRRRIDLNPLLQEGRRIRHGVFSRWKRSMVADIEALPRGSRRRQELFFQIHERLAGESDSPAARQWEAKLHEAERESRLQKSLFDRELFFAIQPRGRLIEMIARYDEVYS